MSRLSQRSKHAFQPIDCAAIPEGLLESTLFGHARGAFTGAVGRRDGLLMQCHGGTAFLDEVGELPLMLQSRFLRTIQNESFTPVGENREIRIDTRFVSATSRDLELGIAASAYMARQCSGTAELKMTPGLTRGLQQRSLETGRWIGWQQNASTW